VGSTQDLLENSKNMLHELILAFCLMLVIVGMLPFIAPKRWRGLVLMLSGVDDFTMRLMGLGCMLLGTILLLIVN
jgi:hypothetical protein